MLVTGRFKIKKNKYVNERNKKLLSKKDLTELFCSIFYIKRAKHFKL